MPLTDLLSRFATEAATPSLTEKSRAALAAVVAIAGVALVSGLLVGGHGLPLLVASMGASAVLIFAAPHSPLTQPWPLVGGHLVSATVGVACARWIGDPVLAAALAVGGAIFLMHVSRCLHPPGGAAALLPVLGGPEVHALGFWFVLAPVGLNVLVMLAVALLLHRYVLRRAYPLRAAGTGQIAHRHQHPGPGPMQRLGISSADLRHALHDIDEFLDVSEQDLESVYRRASALAYRRKFGEIRCADIMTAGPVTVEYGTELEEAWALLRYHKVKALPVVNRSRRVIGMLTLVDFLKRADLKTYDGFVDKLKRFVRRTPGLHTDKPEAVGQIMAAPVVTARADLHITELVPLLSERGLHHIPIVDHEDRLVGMVTQSDLIAALYLGTVACDRGAPVAAA